MRLVPAASVRTSHPCPGRRCRRSRIRESVSWSLLRWGCSAPAGLITPFKRTVKEGAESPGDTPATSRHGVIAQHLGRNTACLPLGVPVEDLDVCEMLALGR